MWEVPNLVKLGSSTNYKKHVGIHLRSLLRNFKPIMRHGTPQNTMNNAKTIKTIHNSPSPYRAPKEFKRLGTPGPRVVDFASRCPGANQMIDLGQSLILKLHASHK